MFIALELSLRLFDGFLIFSVLFGDLLDSEHAIHSLAVIIDHIFFWLGLCDNFVERGFDDLDYIWPCGVLGDL